MAALLRRLFSTATAGAAAGASWPYKDVFHAIIAERDPALLLAKFKSSARLYRFRCNAHVYRVAVRRLASAGDLAAVHNLLSSQKQYPDMAKEGFALRLLTLYGYAGMFDRARELFDEMPSLGCPRTVKSLNAVMGAAVASERCADVPLLFEQLPGELSVVPDVVSYDWLVDAYCRLGHLDDALGVLERMGEADLVPKVETHNKILNGLYEKRRFGDAERVWGVMKEGNVAPNVASYNAKIRGLVLAGEMEEATAVFDGLRGVGLEPNVDSFNALIKGFCEEKNVDAVDKLYGELSKYRFSANYVTYALMVPLLCEAGKIDMAYRVSMMSVTNKRYIDIDVLQRVVDEMVKKSKIEEVKELAKLCTGHYEKDLIVP